MNTKIVFFLKPDSFKGWLMKAFTGCYSYHCGILMEDTQVFYDMYWMRRRRPWGEVLHTLGHEKAVYKIFDSPVEITEKYLVDQILNANTHYGVLDYLQFGFRWVYHLIGKATPNAKGTICSEMINNDLIVHNWHVTYTEVPSPCDLIKGLEGIHCRVKLAFGPKVSEEEKTLFAALPSRDIV